MESRVMKEIVGLTPGSGFGESNQVALQGAIEELQAAGGGTIVIPGGVYEFAGAVAIEVATAANATGTLRITGEGAATLVQQDGDLFVVTETYNEDAIGTIVFEGLRLEGNVGSKAA